ncbi:MAG TPA: hypothetical protein VIW67_17525 [Terriglobales bacterium]
MQQLSQETLAKDTSPDHCHRQKSEAYPADGWNVRNVMTVRKKQTDAEREFSVSMEQEEEQNMQT